MSQFMIVAVTNRATEGTHYQEIGLFDGRFGFKNDKYAIWKAVQYAAGAKILLRKIWLL